MGAVWGDIKAGDILFPIAGTWCSGDREIPLAGLTTDSRTVRRGELFWALKGERFDGHDFVSHAIRNGAAGVVVQRGRWHPESGNKAGSPVPVVIEVDDTLKALGDLAGWWRRSHEVRVAAITGSTGKTTTKEITARILELGKSTLKNQGNFNNLIGLPLTLLKLKAHHRNGVLEMGMNRRGEIGRLTEIADPHVGVITNVGMAHLEGVGDLEGVARAKTELVEKISPKSKVILNGDDLLLMQSAAPYKKEVITFGLGEKNDVRVTDIRDAGRKGTFFNIRYQGRSWAVTLPIPGLHNVLNAAAAAAIGLCLNEPPEHIVEGLGLFEGVKGRFVTSLLTRGVMLVDDTYNANPSSLQASLASLGSLTDVGGRIMVGLGDMMELGDAATAAHIRAGGMVAELRPDRFFSMGEHAGEMVKGAIEAGLSPSRVHIVETHRQMAKGIEKGIKEGDLIFLKGSRKMGLEKVVQLLKASLS
ncbi:MAG: UDP-N-acetylmuramoyl-tripeptide--D-alanyl-D-alanine ligase [Deltaproteobacteria bacterium]|nr:UDP-N-acetylmuramoyl-tripeptide--D-alanyl-D-alanine ligase [Deltaproteobacteria bacterium]